MRRPEGFALRSSRSSQTEVCMSLDPFHKRVNPAWHLFRVEHLSSSFLLGCGTAKPTGQRRLIVSAWLSFIFSLLFFFFSISSVGRTVCARTHPSRRGWHPDQIASFHKKCNLWSITNVLSRPSFPSFLLRPFPSYFTSAHNSLTKSFFDAGVSHDSRKNVSVVRAGETEKSVKAKMWAGWDGNWRTHRAHSSCWMWGPGNAKQARKKKKRKLHTHSSFSTHSMNHIR